LVDQYELKICDLETLARSQADLAEIELKLSDAELRIDAERQKFSGEGQFNAIIHFGRVLANGKPTDVNQLWAENARLTVQVKNLTRDVEGLAEQVSAAEKSNESLQKEILALKEMTSDSGEMVNEFDLRKALQIVSNEILVMEKNLSRGEENFRSEYKALEQTVENLKEKKLDLKVAKDQLEERFSCLKKITSAQ
jgi:outer membrane murein-binding lipoprotein Lpp